MARDVVDSSKRDTSSQQDVRAGSGGGVRPGSSGSASNVVISGPGSRDVGSRSRLVESVNREGLSPSRGVSQGSASYSYSGGPSYAGGAQTQAPAPQQSAAQTKARNTPQKSPEEKRQEREEKKAAEEAVIKPTSMNLSADDVEESKKTTAQAPVEAPVAKKPKRKKSKRAAANAVQPTEQSSTQQQIPAKTDVNTLVPVRPRWNTTAGPVWKSPADYATPARLSQYVESKKPTIKAPKTRALLGPAGIDADEVSRLLADYSPSNTGEPVGIKATVGRRSAKTKRMQEEDGIPTTLIKDLEFSPAELFEQEDERQEGLRDIWLDIGRNEARQNDSYRMQQLATENTKRRNEYIEQSIRDNESYQEHKREAAVAHEKELKRDVSDDVLEWISDIGFDRGVSVPSAMSKDDIRKEFAKRMERAGTVPKSIGESRQANAYAEFNYEDTAGENVLNAQKAADSTASIIANPLMIKIEGMDIERKPIKGNPDIVEARFVFDNRKQRNVAGAIMSVRNLYACDTVKALSIIYERLGLGVDSKGLICGKAINEFELPAIALIEAAHDIKISQETYGHPLGIVKGKPFGVAGGGSRDRTGMFPILGGTRCYPLGYMPKELFHELRKDPSSDLYGVTDRQFYGMLADTWLNSTQPAILANTDGPLGWQAAALNMAMEGLMSINGIPLETLNIPEYAVFRTREMIQADEMDAGNEAAREAFEAKKEYFPDVMSRFARRHFKDSKFKYGNQQDRDDSDDQRVDIITPGNSPRGDGILSGASDVIDWYWSIASISQALHIGNMITAPFEAALSTMEQQAVITMQKAYKNHIQKKWNLGDRFSSSEYLTSVIRSDSAVEALEVADTLMRIGGRTALDAFRMDYKNGKEEKWSMTKKDMHKFLKRWNANSPSSPTGAFADKLMIGDGMFKKKHAQQFLEMAMYEMAQANLHGGEVLDASALEELSKAGGYRNGSGEALVSALLDTRAGYEAFKTMGITSLKRTTPWGRAVDYVMQKNGATNTAVRLVFGNFAKYRMGRYSRLIPGTNTFSYITSCLIKKGAMSVADRTNVANGFMSGFHQAAEAISRISDYQMGMDTAGGTDMSQWTNEDWSSFKSGLYKNMTYDLVMFGGNYIAMGLLTKMVIMFLGGIRPPDDPEKITLAEEWIVNNLKVPVKMSWFMDDLLGCGAPFAYAWLVSEGFDIRDKDGNVTEHVEGGSARANQTAASVFNNMVKSFYEPRHIIDAIDFITNLPANINEFGNPPLDDDIKEYYGDDISKMTEGELRKEWRAAGIQSLAYDMFGSLTPPILNELLPGTRDSIWSDQWQHDTSKRYRDEKYGRERAKNEDRTERVSYLDHMRMQKTQDNVIAAFLADLFDARDGIEYQYANMPIRTTGDPRNLADESYMQEFDLGLELENGTDNLDLNDDGKKDTAEEREAVLFEKANNLCEHIVNNYILTDKYPERAVAEGFVIPAEARLNAINYCYSKIGRGGSIWSDFYARKEEEGYLPEEEFQAAQAEEDLYENILFNWLQNEDIPWRAPRYGYLRTDYGTMYVDSEGNASSWTNPDAKAISYPYGNGIVGLNPFTSPRDTGVYDYGSPTWDTWLDDNGNPINEDMIYEEARKAGRMPEDIGRGEWKGRNVIDIISADGVLGDGDRPTLDVRDLLAMEGTIPDYLRNPTTEAIESILGIRSYLPDNQNNEKATGQKSEGNKSSGGWNSYGYPRSYGGRSYSGRSYGGRSYGGGYGGGYSYGGGSSNYNPKIYSTSRNVNGGRASGMDVRQPYKATTTYLRPSFYTKGSREAYERSDI